MNKFLRTFIVIPPFLVVTVHSIIGLTFTLLRDILYLAFNRPNYWNVTNEFFSVVEEFKSWVYYWKTGKL